MPSLPTRQVHLDFHTSPHVPGVGAEFDAAAFIGTLQAARVNSITIFAKCHHGYSYYPTTIGTPHPHLRRDLLGEMIATRPASARRSTPPSSGMSWPGRPTRSGGRSRRMAVPPGHPTRRSGQAGRICA
jgi:hypothetical protein